RSMLIFFRVVRPECSAEETDEFSDGNESALKSGLGRTGSWIRGSAGATGPVGFEGAAATGGGACGEATGADAAATAPTAIFATTVPIATSLPSGTRILRTPDSSASSSVETLSVSSVTRTSPLLTAEPSGLCQRATFAVVMESPAAGTFTSISLPEVEAAGAGGWAFA